MRIATHLSAFVLFAVGAAAAGAQEIRGADVYRAACVMCHQAQGEGAAGLAPPLKGSYWGKLAATKTYVPGVLLAGIHGPIQTDAGQFMGVMPTQNRLSDAEIAAVSTYLFTDFNGQATVVEAAEVEKLRAKPLSVTELRALRKQATAK